MYRGSGGRDGAEKEERRKPEAGVEGERIKKGRQLSEEKSHSSYGINNGTARLGLLDKVISLSTALSKLQLSGSLGKRSENRKDAYKHLVDKPEAF